MWRKGALASLLAVLVALLIGQSAAATAQPIASIALPAPGTSEDLYEGCNAISLTFPDRTSSFTVVQAVTPAGSIESIWRHDPQTNRYLGFSPAALVASDLETVGYLDVVWLCVHEAPAPGCSCAS
jgi:hypothetical protein